jgi:hypothetical protein
MRRGRRVPPFLSKEKTMRKGTIMVALVALLVGLFAAVAYAEVLNGTSGNNNLIDPTAGNDQIYARGGTDVIDGDFGTPGEDNDADLLKGQRGPDNVSGVDEDTLDTVAGNRGNDTCLIDENIVTHATDAVGGSCNEVIEVPFGIE